MQSLRVVLAGCGGMSREWISTARGMEGVEIVGLVDMVPAAAQTRREEFGLKAEVGDDLASMLRLTRPDLVFDVTVPEAHASVAQTAFAHGCHVLAEKPMADSLEAGRAALAAAQRAGRLYAVMQNRRYQRSIRRVREFLRRGWIGPLTTVHVDFFLGPHFGGFRDQMAHVLLVDMAIHTFDALRFVSGADPLSAYCHEWNPSGSWYAHGASAAAIFEMTGGVVATYRGSWCAEGVNTSWECDWRFLGQTGSATWDGAESFRAQAVAPGVQTGLMREQATLSLPDLDTSAVQDGHASCIRHFIDCVRTGATPETHAADNLKSLSMVFGAVESAERRARVAI